MYKYLLSLILITSSFLIWAQPSQSSFKYQNKTRSFIIYTPTDYQLGESLPLVINMHAFVGTAAGQMNYTKYNRLADTARCIVVYPNGLGGRWNSGTFFGLSSNVDDVGFIATLIDYMILYYRIDPTKVYATGYSAGGFMSYKLACDLTNRIAAIAPVAASMVPEGNFDNCTPQRPFPILAINSVDDPITQYNGFVSVTPVEEVMEFWQEINDCDIEPTVSDVPNIVQNDGSTAKQITYNNCLNSELILFKQFGAGHTWPGANPVFILGNTNQDIHATKDSWAFFNRHEIPSELVCDQPQNLSFSLENEMVTLAWDEVDGIDFYTVFGQLPSGEIVYIENIQTTSLNLPVSEIGTFNWAVRAQCESGHVNWSTIQTNMLSGRQTPKYSINLFPNPANNIVNLAIENNKEVLEFYVLDTFGKIVKSGNINGNSTTINITSLSKGFYTVQLPLINQRIGFSKLE